MDYSTFAEVKNYGPRLQEANNQEEEKERWENYQMKLRALNFRIKVHLRSYGNKMNR